MKNPSAHRRLSAAVLAGAITFTGLGLTPAVAAPAAAEAASYAETLTANVISDSGTGYGVEEIYYTIDAYAGDDHILTGENVFHTGPDNANHTRAYTFSVKLTDQPQVITQLVAKHKDNLAGADKLVVLENPLVIPAHQPWPPSVLTTEIIMPEIKMGVDEKGYTVFSYDSSEIGTTSADLEREQLYLEAWIDGENQGRFEDMTAYRCDGPGSLFDGKQVELRALYTSKIDWTARHNAVIVDCPANIPLALKLGQDTTSVKPGETVAFTIDEVAGTYGKDATITWAVDGRTVDGATGMSFQAPDVAFTAIQATVTIEDREGEKLTRTAGWANPTPAPGDGEDEKPGTNPGAGTDPGTDTDPGAGTDPGTDTTPGAGTDPGTGTDPGAGTDPGTGTDPGADTDPGAKPDTSADPSVDDDGDRSPIKSDCEGLCDKGDTPVPPSGSRNIIDSFGSKPLTGFKKPADVGGPSAPRVMSTLAR